MVTFFHTQQNKLMKESIMGEYDTPKHSNLKEYSESTKKLHIKSISLRHRVLMKKLLAGKTLKASAEDLGYNYERAVIVANSPLFREEMDRMRKEVEKGVIELETEVEHMDGGVKARMEEEAFNSLRVILSLRDGGTSERVRQVSALEILDRAGYGKTDKVEGKIVLDSSPGLVNAIKEAVGEMRGKGKEKE